MRAFKQPRTGCQGPLITKAGGSQTVPSQKAETHLCSEASDLQLCSRQECPTSIKAFQMDRERTFSVFPVVYLNPLGTKTAKAGENGFQRTPGPEMCQAALPHPQQCQPHLGSCAQVCSLLRADTACMESTLLLKDKIFSSYMNFYQIKQGSALPAMANSTHTAKGESRVSHSSEKT